MKASELREKYSDVGFERIIRKIEFAASVGYRRDLVYIANATYIPRLEALGYNVRGLTRWQRMGVEPSATHEVTW